ncbi:MAG: HAMP domain-containing protein [Thermoleophilia bacterium]|nr:HAMP domain-containing protein [Thermoleophilia bacterium]
MTLRLRLLLALVGLVAVALLIADATTYFSLRSFLVDRVDQQLEEARTPVGFDLAAEAQLSDVPLDGDARRPRRLPPGTYGELRDADGETLAAVTYSYSDVEQPTPALPSPLPGAARAGITLFSTGSNAGESVRFRVLVQGFPDIERVFIVAVPLTDVQQTLSRLLFIELLVTVLALAGLGALSWWLVKRELRPLEAMATTAGVIAAGDLSRRVEPAEPKTEVGRLGLALNRMLEQIEQAFDERRHSEEKLRRFVADASHELRTPLTSVRGYAEVFRRGARDDPEDLETAMRRIEDESRRMGVMVDELLLLARLGEGRRPERAPVDLARVVADCVGDAGLAEPERAADLSLESPETLVVTGDDTQLRQVVTNLVGNAVRHTPEGTPIRVRLGLTGGEARLSVADEGPGLAPEHAARVFEPFYRADPSRARETGGAGLGLAIVAAIVADHGGTVDVESVEGEGATFTVRLPLGPAPAPGGGSPSASGPAAADTPPGGGGGAPASSPAPVDSPPSAG